MRSALLCWGFWSCEVLSVLLRALQADEGLEMVGPKSSREGTKAARPLIGPRKTKIIAGKKDIKNILG